MSRVYSCLLRFEGVKNTRKGGLNCVGLFLNLFRSL